MRIASWLMKSLRSLKERQDATQHEQAPNSIAASSLSLFDIAFVERQSKSIFGIDKVRSISAVQGRGRISLGLTPARTDFRRLELPFSI
jgi:hypothetical protein